MASATTQGEANPKDQVKVGELPPGDGEVERKASDKREFATQGKADIASAILDVIQAILDGVKADNASREQFTQGVVSRMYSEYPGFNWMICHPSHSYQWDGTQHVDWDHWHEEFDIQIGGTIGYEVYWARSGTFSLHGDGGFINWAYIGNVQSRSSDGRILRFGPL